MSWSTIVIQFFIVLVIRGSYGGSIECPINEHPTDCVNACPTPTCSDPRPADCNFLVCNKGCECDEGYVRTQKPNGPCIPISRCNNCLRPGFEFKECGSLCSTTCSNLGRICPQVCVEGCFCAGGKVLNEATNKCVEKSQCPKKCQ